MRRIAILTALLLTGSIGVATSAMGGEEEHTYFIEMDNAFGLVEGSEVKIKGVIAGVVDGFDINENKKAVAQVTLNGEISELGTETTCSTEPQSLIAEYFIDCDPKGLAIDDSGEGRDLDNAELVNNPDIPAERVTQTVQNDLAQSALREPYKRRLQLIINEFGTALAGNPEELNAAIRRGAPALRELRGALRILGQQNKIIKNLNVNSDRVLTELEAKKKDVSRFIVEAGETAEASAERRTDLQANFELLDDFLIELRPTLADLDDLAVAQTPLLADLRAAAPGLNTLAQNLPAFNDASADSLVSLGDAAVVGKRALGKGKEELDALGDAGKDAFKAADPLAKFFRDVDDPKRIVEIDQRAADDTERAAPTGYTGLEGLLRYVYHQAGALNQYDQIGHTLHFSIFNFEAGPCGHFSSGRHSDGTPYFPKEGGGETLDPAQADRCVAMLGSSQPGITYDPGLPPYDSSVCPDGSEAPELCSDTTSAPASTTRRNGKRGGGNSNSISVPDLPGGNGGGGSGWRLRRKRRRRKRLRRRHQWL